jgi:hypothetical protein
VFLGCILYNKLLIISNVEFHCKLKGRIMTTPKFVGGQGEKRVSTVHTHLQLVSAMQTVLQD